MHPARRPALPALLAISLLVAVFAAVPARAASPTARIAARLDHALTGAGSRSGVFVRDLRTGATLYSARAATPRIPASVEKLLTTSTALRRFGPQGRLTTDVLTTDPVDAARHTTGDLVLAGGGDPTLDRAGINALAHRVARLVRRVDGAVVGDESRFDARRGGPRTDWAYDRDVEGVLGALTLGRGWSPTGSPALAAARAFAHALRARGVKIAGATRTGPGAPLQNLVADIPSPTMAELATRTNVPSDNFYAETLLKDLGATFAGAGTTPAGAGVVTASAAQIGVRARVADGSGLSRANRIAPREVVDLLGALHRDTVAGPAFEASLAVAGRSGTLTRRMRGTPAAGACRGKTGTIDGVSTLAGYCTPAGGIPVAFAVMMSGVRLDHARAAQDRLVTALASIRATALRAAPAAPARRAP